MSPVYLVAAPTGSPLLGFYIDAEAGHPALPEDAPDARETLDRLLALYDVPEIRARVEAAEFDALLARGQAMSAEMRQRTADMRRFTLEEMAVRVRAARRYPC